LRPEGLLVSGVASFGREGSDAVPGSGDGAESLGACVAEAAEREPHAAEHVLRVLRAVAEADPDLGAPFEPEGLGGEEERDAGTGPAMAFDGPAALVVWDDRVHDAEVAVRLLVVGPCPGEAQLLLPRGIG